MCLYILISKGKDLRDLRDSKYLCKRNWSKIKVFWKMNGRDTISKGFEVFFMDNELKICLKKSYRVCKSNCFHNGKAYAQSSKTQEIALGGSGGKCGLYTKPMLTKGLAFCYTRKTWSKRTICIVFMHLFKNIAYAMVLDEKITNLICVSWIL